VSSKSIAQRIAIAARRLLDRGGSEAVTMRQVAKAVCVTPMAIYRHYPDRAALLNTLADEGFDELAARLTGKSFPDNVKARLMKMLEIYLQHALRNPRLFELMFLKPREGARRYPSDFKAGRSPTASLIAKVVQEGMDSGYLRQDDAWEIVFEMGALSHGLIMLYLGGRMGVTQDRFCSLYRRAFTRYINGIRH
jgi:AcrR family transcriptional regulator